MRQYRILSWETASNGRAIYSLLPDQGNSVRVLVDRQESWKLGDSLVLDEAFVEESREI